MLQNPRRLVRGLYDGEQYHKRLADDGATLKKKPAGIAKIRNGKLALIIYLGSFGERIRTNLDSIKGRKDKSRT